MQNKIYIWLTLGISLSVCRSAMATTKQEAAGAALSNACSSLTPDPKSRRACMESRAESLRCREF